MNVRSIILVVALGLPAVGLLVFGPRGQYGVPPERTVVRYWEKWSGVEGQVMQRVVDRFNATVGATQHIWVEYSSVGNIEQRTLIATAGGDPPDIAGLYDFVIPQYADQGALLPMDDLLAEMAIDPEAFKPIWLDICRYDGHLFALPSTPYTVALYYNRALFREAGLDPDHPPQTTAEFNAYAERLTLRAADGRIVQAGFTPSMAMLGWWPWIWPCFFDGRLWDGHNCTLDTPAGHAAVRWVAELRAAQGAEPMIAFEGTAGAIESAQNPFLAGKIAMMFQGPWLSNWIAKYAPDLDYAVAAFPSVTTERRNVFASADVFVLPTGSRHSREAAQFLAYVLRQDVMEALCREHNKISPFRAPGPDFFAGHPNPFIRVFEELANSPDAFGFPKMPMWLEVLDELKQMLNVVLKEPQRADEVLLVAQRKANEIVSAYQQMAAKRKGGQP